MFLLIHIEVMDSVAICMTLLFLSLLLILCSCDSSVSIVTKLQAERYGTRVQFLTHTRYLLLDQSAQNRLPAPTNLHGKLPEGKSDAA